MRSEAERWKLTWEGMSEADRAEAKQACAVSKDNSYDMLCAANGAM